MNKQMLIGLRALIFLAVCMSLSGNAIAKALKSQKPIKVFILAGDENLLEHGMIEGSKPGAKVPGTLTTAVAENVKYACLKDAKGKWVTRDDVVLCDIHPIHNNTRASGSFLKIGTAFTSGGKTFNAFGPELMFGYTMGNHFDEPVMLLRFATGHPIWFLRGSRSLGHDYLPPSSGSTTEHEGNWDVIHFNWGVWDAVYRDTKSRFYKGRHITSVADYEKNLRTLVARLKKTGATLIWASTTPVYEGEPGRINGDEVKYNEVAAKIMKENGIIIDDLHAESIRQGYPKSNNVHSVGNLAPKVTETILAAIASRKHSTKPLPRVLLIGDSITGSYQKQVMKNLDGKAFVCKNPGNAEYTWTGVAKIDEWLDLKQYLLNGQEYLELTDGVKDTLNQLERFCPGYKGQGYELAGLVWFQGIRDCQSDSMAADYEKNLANLISDLRKDFNTPNLPVAVAAVGFGGDKMGGNIQKVFKAQMAVGNPAKYPEFAGNVKSIDTRKFWPTDTSLNGREWDYKNNAESFLQIGEALGLAMKEMIETK
ncbi:MAG: hypothetical protein K9M75_03140 [Phycisphaerae bacterium]|nr:hypothetical protein [Phycisphaerae bacterium]